MLLNAIIMTLQVGDTKDTNKTMN